MRLLVLLALPLLVLQARAGLAKTGRTLYTDEQSHQARLNIQKYDWARKRLESTEKDVAWVLKMSDQDLWDFIPSADQPRALNVRFGFDCPIHGKEIFKKGGNYPWIMDREHPYQVKCPVGGEVYPSNDFDAWVKGGKKEKLDTHQKYVDDGYGWVDENGNRYWFVAHYIFWQRWRTDILPVIPKLAQIYFLTGDTRYSHKAAIMLAHIAQEYPRMDYTKQAYHNGHYPAPCSGKILDLDWEGSATIVPLSESYDQLYDCFDKDPDLKKFLESKGIADPRNYIEKNFLQEAIKAIETGVVHGNMNYQSQLATVATVLDNHDPAKGFTTEQMVDWILNGGVEIKTLLYNGISRDGSGSEEAIGYNTIWTSAFYDLAEKLKPLGYDLFANPRFKKMTDYYVQTAVADDFAPRIGDCGGSMVSGLEPVWGAYLFSKAYSIWHDPMYAKVLNRIGWPPVSIYEDVQAADKVRSDAEKLGKNLDLKTRDLGGYGLAVLETGGSKNKRAVSMLYGSSGAWHGHLDRLDIEMWAHGKDVLPDVGYPAHWGDKADYWTRSTPSHYCVLIDENHQTGKMEGHLNLMASAGGVQMMDASANNAYQGIASLYRRTVAMVDVSPEDSYLVDIFRVKGGTRHDYSFHGLPFGELSFDGLTLGPAQTKGTLMGEDVEFGKIFDGMKDGGYQYLFNARRGKPDGTWSANWFLKDSKIGLKMTMLAGSAQEVIVADCEPEAKPGYPDKLEYILSRNDTGASSYVSVIEPYKDKPYIRRAQPLKASGAGRDDLAAVRIDSNGCADYIISALDPSRPAGFESDNINFQGEFGSIRMDGSELRSMMLVNGTELSKDGYAIHPAISLCAKISKVDYKNNSITLDRKLPAPEAIVGLVIVISNSDHSASYTVKSIGTESGRTVLNFGDISLIEGIGVIKDIDDSTKSVTVSNRLGGYGMKWAGKLIPGRALVNEALTDSWRIKYYDYGKFDLDSSGPISEKLNAIAKEKVFYIGEANAGDDVMIPSIVNIRLTDNGAFQVKATVPFRLTTPHGAIMVPADMLKNGTAIVGIE